MTDTHPFAKLSGPEEPWNVTLLPLASRREQQATQALENLGQSRSAAEVVTLLASFESQLKAAGW